MPTKKSCVPFSSSPTSCAPLAALRCLRLAIPCAADCVFAPGGPGRPTAGQGFKTGPHCRLLVRMEAFRTSQVPGEPSCSYAVFSDPGRTDASGAWTSSARPPLCPQRRLPRQPFFRGSMARLWNSLCTLRAVDCSAKHATLASGCWPALPGGIGCPQSSMKGFSVVSLHRFPLSQALPGARTFSVLLGSRGTISRGSSPISCISYGAPSRTAVAAPLGAVPGVVRHRGDRPGPGRWRRAIGRAPARTPGARGRSCLKRNEQGIPRCRLPAGRAEVTDWYATMALVCNE
jgi:hypothetical protein